MTVSIVPQTESPFDSIRQVRADGSEFWSARDLMAAVGYDRWENFANAIDKAKASCKAQGHNVADLFRDATKKSGGRPQADVELARFAAYLVMMNGDPRKPEIAMAQGYFAVKTREAETAKPEQLTEIEVAERYLAALKERNALAAKVEADRPLVAQAETFRQADGLRTVGDLANDLKLHAATNYPGVKVKRDDVFDLAGRVGLLIRGNTVRHNQPTARAIEARWVRPKETVYEDSQGRSHAKIGTRLTPKGYGRLWDAAVNNLREHGTVLPEIKEIAG
ncbi:DNA-damage-inducible protein D [Micrococcales bacterium KH10]|nr:DNA-damage-inducible protein D [Micrococcales bacterium KH10]